MTAPLTREVLDTLNKLGKCHSWDEEAIEYYISELGDSLALRNIYVTLCNYSHAKRWFSTELINAMQRIRENHPSIVRQDV